MRLYATTRRRFLKVVSAAGTLPLFSHHKAVARQALLRVRKNVTLLTAQDIASLERGVAIMKQRPKEWPTSWAFQANMHGIVPNEERVIYQGWGSCQHGNWWFLPWHRAYLYYFEQILREASGDPNLSLPYWDWTKADQRSLPKPFLNPNSPLFEANRAPAMNEGAPLEESAVRWEEALAEILFSSPDPQQGFGGQEEPRPGAYQPHGGLESLAHDNVHDEIGGFMGSPATAARDPIFWLHHANIDRLWNQWLREKEGRYNPVDPVWLQSPFYFYGRAGQWVQIALGQFLDTTSPQNLISPYRYDTDEVGAIGALAQAAPGAAPKAGTAAASPVRERKFQTLASQAPARTELGSEPLSVSFSLGAEQQKQLDKVSAAPLPRAGAPGAGAPPIEEPAVRLAIDDIRFDGSPGRFYEVYLNLPDPSLATGSKSMYFAGTLSFFGLHGGHDNAQQMQPQMGATQVIDVTKAVKRLKAQGKLQGELKVTLIEKSAKVQPKPGVVGAPPKATALPRVTFGTLHLLKTSD
jgi:Common central domain of tyrosinase/Protein of unknown function (DUF_B2219)